MPVSDDGIDMTAFLEACKVCHTAVSRAFFFTAQRYDFFVPDVCSNFRQAGYILQGMVQ